MTGKAKTIDELLELKGVVAAGEFTLDGKLVKYKANKGYDLSEEQAWLSDQFTATVTQLFNTLAGAYDKVILMNSEEIIKSDKVLGCVGLYCPVPIFNTALEMEKIEPGRYWG